jgi:hypothetical protein
MPARLIAVLCLAASATAPLPAQAPWLRFSGEAIPLVTTTNAVPGGATLTEGRVVQPMLMLEAGALGDHLLLHAMGDFEGWTMAHGELTPGAYGEGYYDRRHPHTYVHELMLTGANLLGRLDGGAVLSVSAGKGFAPFGTDDPMSRPPVLYPVNHHLSQLLERAVVVVALSAGPVSAEGGAFNGDEPEFPGQWPKWNRFGDSWALRLSGRPASGLEAQVSRAHVHSPEHRPGAGTDQEKSSVSGRWERAVAGRPAYAQAEWARTTEAGGAYAVHSVLAEAAYTVGAGRARPYYRFERTERTEDQRVFGEPFRSVRPHLDSSILGVTRWTIHTLGAAVRAWSVGRVTVWPVAELAVARVAKVGGGVFDPQVFYGRTHFTALTVGARLDWGMSGHRMGYYRGVPETMTMPMEHD